MSELKRAFERAGFTDVKTVLGSGNVVFRAEPQKEESLARQAEAAMKQHLGTSFFTIVRSVDSLRKFLESEPFARFRLKAGSKRVVTFLPKPLKAKPLLPREVEGARILAIAGAEILTAYVPGPKSPIFMALIEKTFGKQITTRTLDTVAKAAKALGDSR